MHGKTIRKGKWVGVILYRYARPKCNPDDEINHYNIKFDYYLRICHGFTCVFVLLQEKKRNGSKDRDRSL